VLAARPSAGRSPGAERNAKRSSPSGRQIRRGSGTLRPVKVESASQSNTKVSQPSPLGQWLGRGSKSGSSKAAPNPSIEGMPKRLRLSVTPHVKR
jgi:hypothetical protein